MYHSNYSVGDNFNSYHKYPNKRKKKFEINLKDKLIIGGIILGVLLILLTVINNIKSYYDSYSYFESLMEEKAKSNVLNQKIPVTSEIFLDMDDLGMTVKNGCSSISGVLVNNDNYKAYLSCDNYVSDVINNDTSKVSLKGDEVVLLPKGIPYLESGVNSDEYKVTGNVGTSEGVYNLTYIAINNNNIVGTLTRKVIVIDNSEIRSLFPTIVLKGNSVIYLEKGTNYHDEGVIAHDNIDLNITNKVKIDGKVNTAIEGEYDITYTVKNSQGYSNYVTRKVIVVNSFSTTFITSSISPSNLTNQGVTINLNIGGNNFDYLILPNNRKVSDKIISYKVEENGVYNFIGYDKDGKSITKVVMVNNIDKTPPTGTCYAYVYPKYAKISFTNTSSKMITGYNYIINGISTNYLKTSNYQANIPDIKSVKVQIKDSINNFSIIDCMVKKMDPTVDNNNIKYYKAFGSEYVIPKTKNNLDTFVRGIKNKISQSADTKNCGSACLSFALYHGYYLQYGDMGKMNLYDACHYKYPIRYDSIYNLDKQEILSMIYNEIINGRIIILQVNGTSERNSRHFVTVVGYRREVYSASELHEEDLLIIDAWAGNMRTMDPQIDANYRSMFSTKGRGYRVDKIRSQYY